MKHQALTFALRLAPPQKTQIGKEPWFVYTGTQRARVHDVRTRPEQTAALVIKGIIVYEHRVLDVLKLAAENQLLIAHTTLSCYQKCSFCIHIY